MMNEEQNSRFTLTIHDDDGAVSLELIDYLSMSKTIFTAEELKDASGLGIAGLCKTIIAISKREYRKGKKG